MGYEHGGDIYSARRHADSSIREILDFSANINPLGMPDGVVEAIGACMKDAIHYPDYDSHDLKAALSAKEGIPSDRILIGNGAADIIWRIPFVVKPASALLISPGFSEYEKALSSYGTKIYRHILRSEDDFRLTERILGDIELYRPDILFICNPNNPTGILTGKSLLSGILDAASKTDTLTVVDECFLDFCDSAHHAGLSGFLSEAGARYKLIVLKAFTKIYAMPGLRLGYCMSDEETIRKLSGFGQPWSVSLPAQAAGLAALRQQGFIERTQLIMETERTYLTCELKKLAVRVIPPDGNFILLYTPKSAEILKALNKQGILLRDCSNFPGLSEGWLRIAVKDHASNAALISALQIFFAGEVSL